MRPGGGCSSSTYRSGCCSRSAPVSRSRSHSAIPGGLTRGATGPNGISHWASTGTVLALGAAAAAIIAFVAIEARSRQPLLPLWIFASRNRTGVYLILLCLASTFFGMFFFLTLFTQVVWGYSALRGGF